ncbi:Ig domain-containing protein [Brevibacillus sp. GCM10020057]|uniref:Ig-like domain-containing protein n=1 Tax=Brevibacillus sp. GCM10020057 TaxID=3317327 RepID=UPI003626C40D
MKQMRSKFFQTLAVALATVCAVHLGLPASTYAAQTVNAQAASTYAAQTVNAQAASTYAAQTVNAQAANTSGLVANASSSSITKGKTATVTLTYNGQSLDASRAAWTTSNPDKATVSKGVVTAKGSGTVIITASYNGESVKVRFTINDPDTLTADVYKTTLSKGDQQTISLYFNGKTLDARKANWASTNDSVATVSKGVITAKGKGTAVIAATYKELFVLIDVTVDSNVSGKLEASETTIKMDKGDKKTIKLKYDDKTLSGSKATWTTSKSSVATVDDGEVTAKGTGTATITAEYKGDKVEIEVKVGGSSGKLEASDDEISLRKGEKETIKLKYDGKSVTGSSADWSTSKSSVATVSNGTVTAKAKGTAVIKAKYKGETVEIEVTVKDSNLLEADDTSITIKKGKTATIELFYDDKDVKGSKATWRTSDSSVATVKDGVVTAKKKGTATITAEYKGESVKIKVTVKS